MGVKKIADIRAFESLQRGGQEVSIHNWKPEKGTQTNIYVGFDGDGSLAFAVDVMAQRCIEEMAKNDVDDEIIDQFIDEYKSAVSGLKSSQGYERRERGIEVFNRFVNFELIQKAREISHKPRGEWDHLLEGE